MNFATKREKRALHGFLRALNPDVDLWDRVVVRQDLSVMVTRVRGKPSELFLVPRHLVQLVKESASLKAACVAAGQHVGRIEGNHMVPAHGFVTFVHGVVPGDLQVLRVNSQDRKRASYRRPLRLDVEGAAMDERAARYFVLVDHHGACFALGRWNPRAQRVEIITSLGDYLHEDDPQIPL